MKTKWIFGELRKWAHLSLFCCLFGITQCEAVTKLNNEKDAPPPPPPTEYGVTEDVVDG